MQVVMQTDNNWTAKEGIWSERLNDGHQSYLFITNENPATYVFDDDNGYVFIRHNNIPYKVQSIDLDYILEEDNGD